MREEIRPVSRYRIVAFALAALLTAVGPSAVNAQGPLGAGPRIDIPPPGKSAAQLDALSSRFHSGDVLYGCSRGVDWKPDDAVCTFVLPCVMGLALVQNGAIAMWGFQSLGPGKPQCTTTFFFTQVEATLVSFAEVSTMRAREIINEMNNNPGYGNCRLEKLGEFAEGRGCLTYGVEGKSYCSRSGTDCVDGSTFVKIFNWYLK